MSADTTNGHASLEVRVRFRESSDGVLADVYVWEGDKWMFTRTIRWYVGRSLLLAALAFV